MANKDLVIFGCGGHGRVIADSALDSGWNLLGFVDDSAAVGPRPGLPFPVLGGRTFLVEQLKGKVAVALGIGDNSIRRSVALYLLRQGVELATIVSPRSVISASAQIGMGTVVMPGAIVNSCAKIGAGVILNSGAVIEHDVVLGDYAHVSPKAALGGGAGAGELAHICLGASVIPLVTVGNRSILGAGAVAIRNIPDDVVAIGVPARVTRRIDQQ